MQRLVVIGLGGLSLALGCVIVVEALGSDRVPIAAPAMPPAIPHRAAAAPAIDRPAQVAALLGRPLFSRTRRPQAQPATATTVANAMPRLSGIMISPIGRLAIFAPKGGKPIVTREGSRIGRFTIRTIGPDWVSVLGPHGIQIVRTAFSAASDAGVPPAPAAGPRLLLPRLPPGVFTTKGGISFNTTHPALPTKYDGPPPLSRLPPPARPPPASTPLLAQPATPSQNPSVPPG